MATQPPRQSLAEAIFVASGLTILACPVILAIQAYMWLRYGGWPEFPLYVAWNVAGLPLPETQWGGVEKILIWIFHQPTSGVVLATGIVLIGVGNKVSG